jgi:ureidoacrylate peracid hydrolase
VPAPPVARGRDVFTLDPARSALLVIDMQNAFVAPGAAYETPKARDIVGNLERLLDAAHAYGMPVVWTRSDHSPPYGGVLLKKCPAVAIDGICCAGHESFEFYAGMPQPQPGDHQVVKHKYDAFFETDLDAILRNSGVDTVIITGTATNICCDTTARSAFCRDYQVAFLSDATATFDDEMHEATLKTMDLLFGRVMTTAETLAELDEGAPAAPRDGVVAMTAAAAAGGR